MTRYFFHLFNDIEVQDEHGVECPNLEAAMERARNEAVVMASISVRERRHLVRSHHILVSDAVGTELAVIRFGDVIEVKD